MKIINIFILLIILFIFKWWFFSFEILTSSDWMVLYKEYWNYSSFFPHLYRTNAGLGQLILPIMGLETYYVTTGKLFGPLFGWNLVERIFWFWPFLFISLWSSYLFTKSLIGSLIYTTNTYILMLVAGGQMGISLSYAFIPFVFYYLLKTLLNLKQKKSFFYSIFHLDTLLLIVFFSLLLLLDFRIGYLISITVGMYIVYDSFFVASKKIIPCLIKKVSFMAFVLTVVFLLNAFWLLPFFALGGQTISEFGTQYKSADSVKFFSVALFENSIGMLHPNWPHNIFGKVGFMKPEFLIFPFFIFSSLPFLSLRKNLDLLERKILKKDRHILNVKNMLFFFVVLLFGAFLAKGNNSPFGQLYLFAFDHMPGFIMFRDPTKWYVLVVLSYAFLTPLVLLFFSYLKPKVTIQKKAISTKIFLTIIFLLVWIIVHHDVFLGNVLGTLVPKQIPTEYRELKDLQTKNNSFSRTLWIPSMTNYSLFSSLHPSVDANFFLEEYDILKIGKKITLNKVEEKIKNSSIRYIVLPSKITNSAIEEKDYNKSRQFVVSLLDKENWLTKIYSDNLVVYEVSKYKPKFSISDKKINFLFVSPTEYKIFIKSSQKGDVLTFSEKYDPNWNLLIDHIVIKSKEEKSLNSFRLPTGYNYTATLYYSPQSKVWIGVAVSAFCVVVLIVVSFIARKKTKHD